MDPIEDLRPVVIRPGFVELRVHGVSGTPAGDLLKDHPIRVAGTSKSGFYRSSAGPTYQGIVEAYSWGGMTSGSRLTALWIFLLPFSLFNVVGWMAPRNSGARATITARLLALAGSGLTGVISFLVATVWFARATPFGDGSRSTGWVVATWDVLTESDASRAFSTIALAALVIGALWALSRSSSRRYERTGPGFGEQEMNLGVTARPAESEMKDLWNQPVFVNSLGRIHTAFALAVVTSMAAWSAIEAASSDQPWVNPWSWVGLVAVTGAVTAVASIVAIDKLPKAVNLTSLASIVIALAAVAGTIFSSLEATSVWSEAHAKTASERAFLVLTLGALIGTIWLGVAWRRLVFAFAVVGFMALITIPSGILLQLEPVGSESIRLTAWVIMVIGLIALGWFLAIWDPLRRDETAPEPPTGVTDPATLAAAARSHRLRKAVIAASRIVRVAGTAFTGVTLLAAIWLIARGALPNPTTRWGAIGWILVLGVVLIPFRHSLRRAFGVLALLGAATYWIVENLDFGPDLIGQSADLGFTRGAMTSALTLPLVAVGWFLLRASSQRANRRAIGVFWDLVNFWPRWYHPWAPPPYTEHAIPDLAGRITQLRSQGKKVILSAHSQGAEISVPVILKLTDELGEDTFGDTLGFLSYGCQLGQQYSDLFPQFFNPNTFARVQDSLAWVSLYRETDPLGYDISDLGDDSRLISWDDLAGEVLAHSNYQYSDEYQAALDELMYR